jgi:hypothetical protein
MPFVRVHRETALDVFRSSNCTALHLNLLLLSCIIKFRGAARLS